MTVRFLTSIYRLFSQTAERHPNKIAFKMILKEEPEKTYITYKGLQELIEKAVAYLVRRGVKQGDKVAIVSSYQIGTVVAILATIRTGAVVVVINADLPEQEVRNLLADAKPRIVIADSAWPEILKDTDYQFANTEQIGSGSFYKHFEFTEEELSYEPFTNLHTDTVAYMFTSGTTGKPKAVLLTQENFLASCIGVVKALRVSQEDVVLDITRPFHVTGLAAALVTLITGAGHVYLNDYPKIEEGVIKREKITVFLAVPDAWRALRDRIYKKIKDKFRGRLLLRGARMSIGLDFTHQRVSIHQLFLLTLELSLRQLCRFIVKAQIQRKLTGRQFRFGVSGGGPLDPEIMKDLAAVGIRLINVWGMTETAAPHLAMDEAHIEVKLGSVGKPIPGAEVKIGELPPEFQDVSKPGIGELLVRGPNVFKEYNDPERTRISFVYEENGRRWFKTGDIAWQDEDGYYFIVGRLKNVVVFPTGDNVYLEELQKQVEGKLPPWIKELAFFEGQRARESVLAAVVFPDVNSESLKTQPKTHFEVNGAAHISDKALRSISQKVINEALVGLARFKHIRSSGDILIEYSPLEKTATGDVKTYIYQRRFARERREK